MAGVPRWPDERRAARPVRRLCTAPAMTRFVYATATSLDGFLADADHSLEWLFAVEGGDESLAALDPFVEGVGVMVEGSPTSRWALNHETFLDSPERWQDFYGDTRPFVFPPRPDLPLVPGADIT